MKHLNYKSILSTLFILFCATTNAQQVELNGILYELEYRYYYDGPKVAVTGISDEKIEEVEIPETISYKNKSYAVEVIGEGAFKDNLNIKSVSLSDNITYIIDNAFKGCTNLESVTFGNNVKDIYSAAFDGCSNLKDVTFPGSLEFIGTAAFQNCTGLTDIVIHNNIRALGTAVFFGCKGVKSITIGKGLEEIKMATFGGTPTAIYMLNETPIPCEEYAFLSYSATLYVPIGCKAVFEAASPWNNFKIVEMDFTSIENSKKETNDNIYYNLKGHRVENPKNGIYIVNGKKVIKK